MDIAKQGYKINSYQEAVFESKDGKRKNISEKEVLKMYDAAGKPGVLQDFIKKNFKRPKVKASTKDNGQLSLEDMMQGNKNENVKSKEEFLKLSKDEISLLNETVKNDKEALKACEFYKNHDNSSKVGVDSRRIPLESNDISKIEEASKLRSKYIADYNNDLIRVKWRNEEANKIKNEYERHKKIRDIFEKRTDADYWIGTKDNVYNLDELIEFEAEYNKKEHKPDGKGDESSPYGKLSNYQFRRLQQKGASLWDKNGEKRLYFNDLGLAIAEKIGNETNASDATKKTLTRIASKLFYDIDEGKFYSYFGEIQRGEAKLIFEEANNLLEQLKQEETTNPKDTSRLSDNPNLTASQEQALLEKLGVDVDTEDIYARTRVKPDIRAIEELIGKKYSKIGDESYSKAATRRINETLYNLRYNVNKNEVIGDTKDREGIRDMVQKAIDNLIEDLKRQLPEEPEKPEEQKPEEPEKPEEQKPAEPEKEIQKLIFRSEGLSGGLLRYNALRKGTTKIESKNEYKQVKNINELVKQVKPIKDAHANIKGRAIMDMFGISADLYTKADNIPFPIGPGAVGYCTRQYNEKTGGAYIVEIGLVADRNSPAAETKTAIHECMHAKIGMSGKNKLIEAQFFGSLKGEHLQLKIEEPMVELAGQALTRQIHGEEARKNTHSYATLISSFLPRVWSSDIFKDARKQGSLGIGQEIAKQLTNGNTDFINKVYDSFNANDDKKANSNRMKAIETKVLERTDKVEKIQNDTGVSSIANLVEELKRGTISLEGALNSSQYRELAAVLITKFLEDEDLEALEGLALSF